MNEKYLAIIDLPHHSSISHPHMSNHDRAAQFAPFAALTGYDTSIKEAGRITLNKLHLDVDKIEELNAYKNNEELLDTELFFIRKEVFL